MDIVGTRRRNNRGPVAPGLRAATSGECSGVKWQQNGSHTREAKLNKMTTQTNGSSWSTSSSLIFSTKTGPVSRGSFLIATRSLRNGGLIPKMSCGPRCWRRSCWWRKRRKGKSSHAGRPLSRLGSLCPTCAFCRQTKITQRVFRRASM